MSTQNMLKVFQALEARLKFSRSGMHEVRVTTHFVPSISPT
jgi:hypothetical protein